MKKSAGKSEFVTPTISILIRTKNEENYIEETLVAVLSQSYENIEIIVVDSGSTDKTLQIAEKYPVKIFKIASEDFTYGFALNYGFQKAKGEYVVCLSAHAVPVSKDWLKILISNFDDSKVAAVACKSLPMPDCNPIERRGVLHKYNIPRHEVVEGYPFIFSSSSSMIRKDIWEKVHFDEALSYAEDQYWVGEIRKLKYIIIYEPGAEVYHSHNENLKQIYRRCYNEAYAHKVLGYKKYSLSKLLFDVVAGSIYDMVYLLFKRENPKWLFFVPFRRLAMDYGRYKGFRMIDINAGFLESTLKRIFNPSPEKSRPVK